MRSPAESDVASESIRVQIPSPPIVKFPGTISWNIRANWLGNQAFSIRLFMKSVQTQESSGVSNSITCYKAKSK
jgi:hypothetical protein